MIMPTSGPPGPYLAAQVRAYGIVGLTRAAQDDSGVTTIMALDPITGRELRRTVYLGQDLGLALTDLAYDGVTRPLLDYLRDRTGLHGRAAGRTVVEAERPDGGWARVFLRHGLVVLRERYADGTERTCVRPIARAEASPPPASRHFEATRDQGVIS